jgi:multidrug efflux pump subunit AcrA (membrane-fusion protein)
MKDHSLRSWVSKMSRAHQCVVGLALACALLVTISCGRTGGGSAGVQAAELKPVRVATSVATSREVAISISSNGTFMAEEVSELAPLAAGRVAATPVDVGAWVNQGDVIARLDDRDARLRLEQAEAAQEQAQAALAQSRMRIGLGPNATFDPAVVPEVQVAKAAYESAEAQAKLAAADAKRYASLVATGDVSASNYERERTQAESAQAQADAARRQYEAAVNFARLNNQGVGSAEAALASAHSQTAMARKELDDTVVRAPFAGYVSERHMSVGESVNASSKIATILRANPIRLALQVSEMDAARIHTGMTVVARAAARPEREFTGKVTVLSPAVDASSRAMTIRAEFANPALELRPGMSATVRMLLPQGEQGIFVPATAVLTDSGSNASRVFMIENGVARVRVVQAGNTENGMTRVVSGLSRGAIVAASHLPDLYDGAPVERGN